ncbi:homeodomain-interacting protein kinase 1-like isoform X2 [Scomber scombrus]|uniref:Homeodomain-interacting protein kinase 1-like isoform X2 n=1 Tax=Scomber scombrus TaxID=13677 RepID=A0AAV1Q0J2_SCOSC
MANRKCFVRLFSTRVSARFGILRKYEYPTVVGEGRFGMVLKCLQKDTKDFVAIKIPKRVNATRRELVILQSLMRHQFDQQNIVKFLDSFEMYCGTALVFEALDISLYDYMLNCGRLCLDDIRVITQQVATAFDALRSIRYIHTDVKPDNIMLVNHQVRPLRVKLIDFGVAIRRCEAVQGMKLQTLYFRAPEIILGIRFSEAIDMWSLGCVVAAMMLDYILFPGQDEYEALKYMVELLGQPEDHILKKGRKTNLYFSQTSDNGWRLKTPLEFSEGKYDRFTDYRCYKFPNLDDIKHMRCWKKQNTDAEDLDKCIALLKAMLKMDAAERITPSGVLTHPFIGGGHHNSGNEASQVQTIPESTEKTGAHERMLIHTNQELRDETSASLSLDGDLPLPRFSHQIIRIHPDDNILAPAMTRSVVSQVRSAAAENRVELQHQQDATRLLAHVNKIERIEEWACPDVPDFKYDGPARIQNHDYIPSPAKPHSVVIKVRPAAPENRVELENEESDTSLQSGLNTISKPSTNFTESGTIPAESATTKNTANEEEEVEEEQQQKTNKKSWMKKNLCCCCAGGR